MLITGALLPSVYRVYVLWIRISLYQAQASQILHFGLVILTICRQIRSDYIHSDSIAKPQKAQSITSCAMHLSSCAAANAGMHARSRLLTIMDHHRSSLSSLSSSRSLALRPVLCALIRTYEAFGMLIYARHGEIYVNPRSLFPCLLSPLFHSVNTVYLSHRTFLTSMDFRARLRRGNLVSCRAAILAHRASSQKGKET